ncbi:hypothetical protein DM01DRAFT_1405857 [Hesseltinella vesiculosa]|uniref:Protein YAE1 n=1 Tax=Hesseltinella vesiculosa TaxID=101127 RepID=A0A1X2GPG2_9FUNG|nr:hypothetical protein DM01DRAFT_1405857 [Hesseltinella vesiculosa]
MDDDIWGSSSDDLDYERSIAEKEWNQLQENHGNVGYKVGIVEGQEQHMQKGFDRGYEEGISIGLQLGQLQGRLGAHVAFYQQVEPNESRANALQELFQELTRVDLHHLFDKAYFENPAAPDSAPHRLLQQWQQRIEQALNTN